MSTRCYNSIALPQGTKANPMTIAHAVGEALTALEKKLQADGLRPIWDTVEIATETDTIETHIFGGETHTANVSAGAVSVLAIDPKGASA